MATRKERVRTKRRTLRVRGNLQKGSLPRISVQRSLNHIYGQLIDDNAHHTVVSSSSLQLENLKGDKKAIAHAVGKDLAQRAQTHGIQKALFDRGAYRYHGRVQAFVEGLREGGMQI